MYDSALLYTSKLSSNRGTTLKRSSYLLASIISSARAFNTAACSVSFGTPSPFCSITWAFLQPHTQGVIVPILHAFVQYASARGLSVSMLQSEAIPAVTTSSIVCTDSSNARQPTIRGRHVRTWRRPCRPCAHAHAHAHAGKTCGFRSELLDRPALLPPLHCARPP